MKVAGRLVLFVMLLAALPVGAVPDIPAAPTTVASGSQAGTITVPVVRTVRVVGGLQRAVYLTAPEGDSRLFILEQDGLILVFDGERLLPRPFLDLTGLTDEAGEQGLLGLAFAPDYAESGVFYVNHTDLGGSTNIARYRVGEDDADVADPRSREVLLTLSQPFTNHNGGQIAFGPDGMLYIGLGDGGGGGDPGNRAQDDTTRLGKMLRLDVSGGPGSGFTVPPDNPFVGEPFPRPQVWAKGFRNPYRFSFDRLTGDLYIGDVGQAAWEEVDIEPAGHPGGSNYGWRLMEGAHCHIPASGCNDGTLILPAHEYALDSGRCAVIGGYVYRGSVGSLQGRYLFGDFCSAEVFSLVWAGDNSVTDVRNHTLTLAPTVGSIDFITSFGEDGAGEVYIVDGSRGASEIYRITEIDVPVDRIRPGDSTVVGGLPGGG